MQFISAKTHGPIDYLTGAALLAAPALLGISDEPAASRVAANPNKSMSGSSAGPSRPSRPVGVARSGPSV